jgi:pyruvate kinase
MSFVASTSPHLDACEDLIRQLESLRQSIKTISEMDQLTLSELPPDRVQSAENLLHYLALRSRDIRSLQDRLARLGLDSLGRVESHVLPTINAVLNNLYLVSGQGQTVTGSPDVYSAFSSGEDSLETNTINLLGKYPRKRRVHIIVTMSTEAAGDYMAVHQLLKSGMNCMRINCAQDGPATWSRMIRLLRNAERATGQSCRTLMDLGGPKLRIGPMETVSAIRKIRPVRASDGHVVRPARIWLSGADSALNKMPAADISLIVDSGWLDHVHVGEKIRLTDKRGSSRNWRVREITADGCWAEAKKTAYLSNGTVLQLHDSKQRTEIDGLEPKQCVVVIRTGDVLFISANKDPGKPAIHDVNGERNAEQIQVRITHTRKPVENLEGNRGVNLPDTRLDLPALSAKDQQDLEFAARHADMIGLSFANCAGDVRALRQCLVELGNEDMGIILKIETRRGFANLPEMLLEALKFPACGVMIARGDLAVECGFERMSEIQEEILWVCEAAHVPVIWATQVLEGLTKRGHASRAEITDAAMAQAAEAVMLNKGTHIIEAVRTLDDILQRMQGHHRKKHSMLRKLHLASAFQDSRT